MMQFNKSKPTVNAVQVQANLQQEHSVHVYFRKLKCCLIRQVVKVNSYVATALTISEILKFQIPDLEK